MRKLVAPLHFARGFYFVIIILMETAFKQKIFEIVKQIPEGEVRTYKQIAELAGRPKAYRAVGNILNTNYDPSIPCHRVVRSDGKTGGYNRGSERKVELLKLEKISTMHV
jgi:methylated-DNA-[protein]-cysteine S-methyltransferase